MSEFVGYIAAAGIVATLVTIGGGIIWFYNSAYSSGKKSAKLTQTQKELADAKHAAAILTEQRTIDDTTKRLNDGNF